MDGCMDGSGWRCPAKQIMIAVTWWVCTPRRTPFWCLSPSVCLATIDARLVNTPRLSPGSWLLVAVLDLPSSSRVGECRVRAWCGACGPGVPVTGPIAPPPPLAGRQILHAIPAHPLPADLCLRTDYLPRSRYPRSQQVDTQDSRCPFAVMQNACWLLLLLLLLPPPWFPCLWVTGTLLPLAAPALKGQGRTPGQVQVPRPMSMSIAAHTVLFMSVLLSPLQD